MIFRVRKILSRNSTFQGHHAGEDIIKWGENNMEISRLRAI